MITNNYKLSKDLMIKALILDLNGVFIKSEYLSDRFNKKFGIEQKEFIEVLKKVMVVARKPGCEDSFKLWQSYLKKWDIPLSRKRFFDFWFSGESLVDELVKYVKQLKKKGLKIFILSNNFRERTDYYRKNFPEIFQNIDKAYFSWETGYLKTEPLAYNLVLQENNLSGDECIYFDDSEENIEVARNLGINAYKFENFEQMKFIFSKNLGW